MRYRYAKVYLPPVSPSRTQMHITRSRDLVKSRKIVMSAWAPVMSRRDTLRPINFTMNGEAIEEKKFAMT